MQDVLSMGFRISVSALITWWPMAALMLFALQEGIVSRYMDRAIRLLYVIASLFLLLVALNVCYDILQ